MSGLRDAEWKEGEGGDEHRHRCLVRWVIKKRIEDRDAAYRFLRGYMDSKSYNKGWNVRHPWSRLEQDVMSQWGKGNRGADGDWR